MGWLMDRVKDEHPEFSDECECGARRGEHSLDTVRNESNFEPPLPLNACPDKRGFWGFSKTKKFRMKCALGN